VGYACPFGSVGAGFANGDLIAPVGSVDKGQLGTLEEVIQKGDQVSLWLAQISFDDFNIGQSGEFLCNQTIASSNLGFHAPAYSRGDADK
jgi:hypothetical protein